MTWNDIYILKDKPENISEVSEADEHHYKNTGLI